MSDDIRIRNLRDRLVTLRRQAKTDRPKEIQDRIDQLAAERDALKEEMEEIRQQRVTVELEQIEGAVCGVFGVEPEQIRSKTRKRYVVDARHAILYAAWRKELPMIRAAEWINRHHSTVSQTRDKMIALYENDERIREMLDEVMYCVE